MASNSSQSLLLLGASGQCGGPFLTRFSAAHPSLPITVFLRTTVLDSALLTLPNLKIVRGTFSDLSTLTSLAASHSIIINSASSMDTALTTAILAGAKERKAQTGGNSILLHLSGSGNFAVGPFTGESNTEATPFNDTDPHAVRKIDKTYLPNGPCDELIFRAAATGDVNAYFVCPGGIYGASSDHIARRSEDPLAKGFANAPGVWVKWMVENVENLGHSPYVGEGTSVFRVVHVDDVVDLMLLVAELTLEDKEYEAEDVYRHFYLCVDEELRNRDIAVAFAEVLGKEAKSVRFDEAGTVAK